MAAYELQRDLAEEVEKVLKCMIMKDVKGNQAHLKAFLQRLPIRQQKIREEETGKEETDFILDENESDDMNIMQNTLETETSAFENDPYPYCVVRIDSGSLQPAQGVHKIQTVLVFGVFDDDAECQGDQVIMNMMHKIEERFVKNPVLRDKYRVNDEQGITWALDDTDQYPYFFGAMILSWVTFFVRLEEDKYV